MELNGFMNKGFMNIATNLSVALEIPFSFLMQITNSFGKLVFKKILKKRYSG